MLDDAVVLLASLFAQKVAWAFPRTFQGVLAILFGAGNATAKVTSRVILPKQRDTLVHSQKFMLELWVFQDAMRYNLNALCRAFLQHSTT